MAVIIQRTVGLRSYETTTRWDSPVPAHISIVSLWHLVGNLLLLSKMDRHSKFIFSVNVDWSVLDFISVHLCSHGLYKRIPEIHLPCTGWLVPPYEPPEPYGAADHDCRYINLTANLLCVREPWKTRQIMLPPPSKQGANKTWPVRSPKLWGNRLAANTCVVLKQKCKCRSIYHTSKYLKVINQGNKLLCKTCSNCLPWQIHMYNKLKNMCKTMVFIWMLAK